MDLPSRTALRAGLVLVVLVALSRLVVGVALGPVRDAYRLVVDETSTAGVSAVGAGAAALASVVGGGCAALLLLAWGWLALAVAVCTVDTIRRPADRPRPAPEEDVVRGGVLRPPLVKALVATCLGASALTAPVAAQVRAPGTAAVAVPARSAWAAAVPTHRDGTPDLARSRSGRPDGRVGSTSPSQRVAELLRGLPVPDRPTGRLVVRGAEETTSVRADHSSRPGSHPPTPDVEPDPRATGVDDRPQTSGRSPTTSGSAAGSTRVADVLRVCAGDSLWRLTAELLPDGAPDSTVARGWPLLYRANRSVVGDDPDLLLPGQTLHVGPGLADLVRTSSRTSSRTSDHVPQSLPTRDAGGAP